MFVRLLQGDKARDTMGGMLDAGGIVQVRQLLLGT